MSRNKIFSLVAALALLAIPMAQMTGGDDTEATGTATAQLYFVQADTLEQARESVQAVGAKITAELPTIRG
ncbi:MAG: hypothetical protein AAFN78_20935, partial [Pseudomonadota bacterium]